jgi:peptidylprolyl isomerase/FKBP-type peptidyl-prolyl cis-trans isomerase FklB
MRSGLLAAAALASAALALPALAAPAWDAQAPGVVALPGVEYRVLKSGPAAGETAKRSDDVTVRYDGRFEDGRRFDASPDNGKGTTVFPLQKLIPGWIGVVQLMRPGDVWLVRIPPWLAYGARGKGPIPPDTPLVFTIELVSASPHLDPPAAK